MTLGRHCAFLFNAAVILAYAYSEFWAAVGVFFVTAVLVLALVVASLISGIDELVVAFCDAWMMDDSKNCIVARLMVAAHPNTTRRTLRSTNFIPRPACDFAVTG